MSDVATKIDTQTGDTECEWCSALFTKTSSNAKYCSNDCRKEIAALTYKKRYEQDYTNVPMKKTGLFYRDYIDENAEIAKRRGVKPPVFKESKPMTPSYKVPELSFKRFKEGKEPLVFKHRRIEGWDNE